MNVSPLCPYQIISNLHDEGEGDREKEKYGKKRERES